jgi:F-box and WD-40 domain protein 1/11
MAAFKIRETMAGTLLLGACTDSKVRLYNVETGAELACLEGHTNVVRSVHFTEQEEGKIAGECNKIVSASYDGTVRVWTLQLEDPFHWECLYSISCMEAATPAPEPGQATKPVDIERAGVKRRTFEFAICCWIGSTVYCCGESTQIVVWRLPTESTDAAK